MTLLLYLITREWTLSLLLPYLFLVFCSTVVVRTPFTGQHFQPELFWSWESWSQQREQVIANIIMFLPVGLLGYPMLGWKVVPASFLGSAMIEVLQLISARGLCEYDDILHNTAGAVMGMILSVVVRAIVDRVLRGDKDYEIDEDKE